MIGLHAGLAFLCCLVGSGPDQETILMAFNKSAKPSCLTEHHTKAEMIRQKNGYALKVDFEQVDWPNVFVTAPPNHWDWSRYAGIKVDVQNPMETPVDFCIRIDNEGADGNEHCNQQSRRLAPGEQATVVLRFNAEDGKPFWGMRGIPERGPVGKGATIDLTRITAFQFYLNKPSSPQTLVFHKVCLFGPVGNLATKVPFPFVDAFGQYKHATWPGKLKSEAELATRAKREAARLASAHTGLEFDPHGGWLGGPTLKATSFFRTEKVDGKWWLVTPEGHLFFSIGLDCITHREPTFVSGRETWFEWLPDPSTPPYSRLFSEVSGVHSMAEAIGGKGKTFSFYGANLIRKYGNDWSTRWRETTYARIRKWGFNTIGNWSQADVLDHSPIPYVVCIGLGGEVRPLEGGRGYWGHLKDVFDPRFAKTVESSIEPVARQHAATPECIGYFVDNELSWKSLQYGVLASPPDQFARIAFVQDLTAKYGTLDKLNTAWGNSAPDWNSLRTPEKMNETCSEDVEAFVYKFARHYFEAINTALKKYAPNQLYLGCRFSYNPPSVVKACADVVDVVSFNFYTPDIPADRYCGKEDLGKPIIIGEFHFGALDRGMFHPGLVETKNQQDRAAHYAHYVNSVADNPNFVGCHWFQYVDEPITGRSLDGENYNIGFVDVTDTPYPEMVKVATKTHHQLYARRYGKSH